MFTVTFFITSFISILSVVNPFTAMPVFLALTENQTDEHRTLQAGKAAFFMVCILSMFLVGGTYIISFFGISLEGIRIAGGLMIMRWAYTLLNPDLGGRKLSDEDREEAMTKGDISFSPLAMPLLSGPGSIAVVLGLASRAEEIADFILLFLSICLVSLTAYLVLLVSPQAVKILGKTGMNALTRMMGFITLCIGVQFIINGITPILFGLGLQF
ncbi:MAG: MarC family NAAT transporter [Balneolales bacterium]